MSRELDGVLLTPAAAAAFCVLVAVVLALPPGGDGTRSRPGPCRGASRPRALLAGVLQPRRRARADPSRIDPALVLELVAAALAAGTHPAMALAAVGEAVGGEEGGALVSVGNRMQLGAGEATVWAAAPPGCRDDLRRCLSLSARTGAPASLLLREAAAEGRRARRRAREAAAHRVGVRLVLPLGLCALPAFAAWGVVPVVLGLARAVVLP